MAYGLIVVCAGLVTLPLVLRGPSCGHDFDFHLQSWLAVASAWGGGGSGGSFVLWPHWLAAANYGAGEPRFVFYPPVSWALGAALGGLLPWMMVAQALTFLALAGSGVAFFHMARLWVRPPVAAGAACVYLANPYLLFVAYERTAYGELLGAVAMPLVVLFALRPGGVRVAALGLVIAVLWLTNAPAAVMGCYLLGLCALAVSVAGRTVVPLGKSVAALALGTGAAAVYVLPAWYEQRWVEIARAVGSGMRVEDSFLFGHTGEAFHDQVLHTASSISVGVLAVGLVGVGLVSGLRRVFAAGGRGLVGNPEPPVGTVGVVLVGIFFLLLPWSDSVWRLAPELHFLQFPWRWMLVGGLATALAVGCVADLLWSAVSGSMAKPGRRALAVAACAVLCAGAWGAGRFAERSFAQYCDDEDNVAAQELLVAPGLPTVAGFEGTDEYTSLGADNGEIQQGLPEVRLLRAPGEDEGDDSTAPNPAWHEGAAPNGTSAIAEWSPEHKRLSVTAWTPGYAVLRLMEYPAWQVRLNGRLLSERGAGWPHREDGLLTVPVPAGTTRIDVSYHATPDVYAARGLSVVCLCALIATGVWERRWRAAASGVSYDET